MYMSYDWVTNSRLRKHPHERHSDSPFVRHVAGFGQELENYYKTEHLAKAIIHSLQMVDLPCLYQSRLRSDQAARDDFSVERL